MKLIHIVENLDKGAVENWLVTTFLESRKIRPDIEWHFYCILNKKGRLDDLVVQNGGKVIYTQYPLSSKFKFLIGLRRVLKNNRYDVIHCHHDYLSGFYLLSTIGIKIKRKIIHIHNTDKALPVVNKYLHFFLLKLFHLICCFLGDVIVGISETTLYHFIGNKVTKSKKYRVLYYGVDFSKFKLEINELDIKNSLNLPLGNKIILFAGRLTFLKNPLFALQIFDELLKINSNFILLVVGEGDLLKELKNFAIAHHIEDKIKFLGWRNDLSNLMRISDVFLFPRIEKPIEGLGLVVVESQAASLPMLLSYGIPKDAIVVKSLVNYKSIKDSVRSWAHDLYIIANTKYNKNYVLEMDNSKFSLTNSTLKLIELYNF